jgi:hypothetical protein
MDTKAVAKVIAASAVREAVSQAKWVSREAAKPAPELVEKTRDVAEQLVMQDPFFQSKRMGATALSILTAVLSAPPVQAELMVLLGTAIPPTLVPLGTALLAALLAALSKRADLRPTRGSGPFLEE